MNTGVSISLLSILISLFTLTCSCSYSLSPIQEDSQTKYFSLQHIAPFKIGRHIPGSFSKPQRIPGFFKSKFKDSPWTDQNLPIYTHFYNNNSELIAEKFFHLGAHERMEWTFSGSLNHTLSIAPSSIPVSLDWSLYCNDKKIFSFRDYRFSEKYSIRCEGSGSSRLILKNESEQNILIPNILLSPQDINEREFSVPTSNPKILFLVIDSFRFDALGKYNATPFLDEFKKDSISFQQHFVNSAWTRPSTTIFFTGNYASESPLNIWDYPLSKEEVNDFYKQSPPLPAILSGFGFYSQMIGNNPFMDTIPGIGVDFGFSNVVDFSDQEEDTIPITNYFIDKYKKIPDSHFIFLNYNDPHRPYTPPVAYLNQLIIPQSDKRNMPNQKLNYLGEVAFVDANIRRVIEHLKEQETYDDTLIIITSDHGEVMDAKHAYSPFSETFTMYGHGQGLYQEDIHVPLLIKFPKKSFFSKFHGSATNFQTRSIDIMPTILKECNIETIHTIKQQSIPSMRGLPLQSLILGEDESRREYYGETRGAKAYQKGNWKLKKKTYEFHRLGTTWEGEQKPEIEYFFDLENDPLEHAPVKNPFQLPSKEDLFELSLNPYQLPIYKELKEKLNTTIPPKSYYGIRINQKDLSENFIQGNLKIEITILHGKLKNVYGMDYFPESSIQNLGTKQIISVNLGDFKNRQTEFFFQIYPDVSEPTFKIVHERLPLSPKLWGVGSFDLNPISCNSKECKELILADSGIPPAVKEFRVQIWKVGTVASTLVDRKNLGSEAMNALQKQGYVD